MYGQQARTGVPELDAVLATAQMVTPDQKMPTVAAHVAQAAVQKLMPQGIAQGMNQVRQDVQAAIPSVARNAQEAQMRQALQLAMRPKPAGIEGLPSNVRVAEGGVVGYAGPEGSFVGGPRRVDVSGDIPIYAPREDKESGETEAEYRARKAREAEEAQGERPIPRGLRWIQENILRPMSQAGGQRMAEMRGTPETPTASPAPIRAPQVDFRDSRYRTTELRKGEEGVLEKIGPAPLDKKPEIQLLTSSSAPRPPAQRPPAPAQQAAPTGVAAALAQRPTYDTAGIAAFGTPYIQAGEGDVRRIREAEGKRAELEKTLPDLSAKGIAALQQRMRDVETAETTRKENLGLDRVIQQLLGRAQGSGGAARADIQFMNTQRAAEDAFSQARLGNQQAQLLLKKAQQERQLGREDRAIALEKEAATRMEKARDDALRAQQIAQSGEAAKYQGAVQMRGQDAQTREGELNRAQNERLERIRRATANQPGEAERIFNEYTRRKAIDPKDAEDYLTTIDRIKGSGRGISERQDVNELKALITSLKDQADPLKNFDKSSREQASVLLKQAQDKLAQMSGLGGGGTGSQAPMYAKNPKTNERIMSTDGGQTWKPAQ
jgi:hypothetical protein